MRLNKLCIAAVTVALLAIGGKAHAENSQLDLSVDNSAGFLGVDLRKTDGTTVSGVSAGAFNASWHVNTPKPPNMPNSFSTFCVDMNHFQTSPQTVNLQPVGPGVPGSDPKMLQVAWLYNNHLGEVLAANGVDRQIKGAALQIAMWGVIQGATVVDDPTPGHFFVSKVNGHTSEVTSLADQYLAALGNSVDSAVLLKVDRTVMGDKGQDMIGPPPSAVPEPSSLLLLVSGGLAGLGVVRFRIPRKRQPTA